MTDATEDAFRVLADPTRRRILDLLAQHGTRSVSALAAAFPDLVASGISKHLMAMRAAGLVTATRLGRHQIYEIDAEGFSRALGPWVAKYDAYWAASLEALRTLAESDDEDDR